MRAGSKGHSQRGSATTARRKRQANMQAHAEISAIRRPRAQLRTSWLGRARKTVYIERVLELPGPE